MEYQNISAHLRQYLAVDEEDGELLSDIAEPLRRVDFELVEGWEHIQNVYKRWSASDIEEIITARTFRQILQAGIVCAAVSNIPGAAAVNAATVAMAAGQQLIGNSLIVAAACLCAPGGISNPGKSYGWGFLGSMNDLLWVVRDMSTGTGVLKCTARGPITRPSIGTTHIHFAVKRNLVALILGGVSLTYDNQGEIKDVLILLGCAIVAEFLRHMAGRIASKSVKYAPYASPRQNEVTEITRRNYNVLEGLYNSTSRGMVANMSLTDFIRTKGHTLEIVQSITISYKWTRGLLAGLCVLLYTLAAISTTIAVALLCAVGSDWPFLGVFCLYIGAQVGTKGFTALTTKQDDETTRYPFAPPPSPPLAPRRAMTQEVFLHPDLPVEVVGFQAAKTTEDDAEHILKCGVPSVDMMPYHTAYVFMETFDLALRDMLNTRHRSYRNYTNYAYALAGRDGTSHYYEAEEWYLPDMIGNIDAHGLIVGQAQLSENKDDFYKTDISQYLRSPRMQAADWVLMIGLWMLDHLMRVNIGKAFDTQIPAYEDDYFQDFWAYLLYSETHVACEDCTAVNGLIKQIFPETFNLSIVASIAKYDDLIRPEFGNFIATAQSWDAAQFTIASKLQPTITRKEAVKGIGHMLYWLITNWKPISKCAANVYVQQLKFNPSDVTPPTLSRLEWRCGQHKFFVSASVPTWPYATLLGGPETTHDTRIALLSAIMGLRQNHGMLTNAEQSLQREVHRHTTVAEVEELRI